MFDEASYRWARAEVAESRMEASQWALLEDEFRLTRMAGLLSTAHRPVGAHVQRTQSALLNDMASVVLADDSPEPCVLPNPGFAHFQRRCGAFRGLGEQLAEGQPHCLATNAALYKHVAAGGGYDKPRCMFHIVNLWLQPVADVRVTVRDIGPE